MTKEEISDVVDKYKSDAEEDGKDLDDWEIKEKLKEDHGIDVSISFEKGTMIDDDMDEGDAKQVMIKSFLEPVGLEPIKRIVNPINNEFGNTEENRYSSISDIKFNISEDSNYYTRNTDGFKNIEGLNIGYPMILLAPEGEVVISLSLLIDEDVKSKDIDDFLSKYENVEVNGHKLTEDDIIYAEDSVYNVLKEDDEGFNFEDRDIALFEDSILEVQVYVPMEDVFGGISDFDDMLKDYHEDKIEDDAIIKSLWEDMLDEKPVITLNGTEWELTEELRTGESLKEEGREEFDAEGDYLINPVVQ